MKNKMTKEEYNLAILRKRARKINTDARKVAPASVQKSKKTYTRKLKHGKIIRNWED